jgi:ornithine cyclodeaminase
MGWDFPRVHGEVHIKGAHLEGSPLFTFKVATGFYGNVELGVPTGSGLVLMFDADSGFPRGILADNGYLTDLRTGAAGALALEHLAPRKPLVVAVIGAGVQAKMQLRLMARVRRLAEVRIWSRTQARAQAFQEKVAPGPGGTIVAAASVREAVTGADVVLTVTPSRAPLVEAGWVRRGATVIAVGSDGPVKQELDAKLVAGADKLVTDLTVQCVSLGELHHALEEGLMTPEDVYAELGDIVIGAKPGREGDETIVCDLTGVGAQDAAIAEAVFVELTGREQRTGG